MTRQQLLSPLALEAEFLYRLQKRLQKGAVEYGDASFDKPIPETIEQLMEEVEDIAGWAFVLWGNLHKRLDRIRRATEQQPECDGC